MIGNVAGGARAAAWEGVSRPVRAVVRAGYCRPVDGGYAVDVEVVHPVTREPTGERIEEVPMPALWLGPDGRGLYAPPAAGQIVVLDWIDGSRGHPFIAGCDGERRQPRQPVPAGSLVLTDGRGGSITLAGDGAVTVAGGEGRLQVADRLQIRNDAQNLRAVLLAFIDAVIGLSTTGTAVAQSASPATQAALRQVSRRVKELLA